MFLLRLLANLFKCIRMNYSIESYEFKLERRNGGNNIGRLKTGMQELGPQLTEITFHGGNYRFASRRFFHLVAANCNPSKLKRLKLINVQMEAVDAKRCEPILKKLKKLELIDWIAAEVLDLETLILKCEDISELTLVNLNNFDGDFLTNLSKRLTAINLQNLKTFRDTFQC